MSRLRSLVMSALGTERRSWRIEAPLSLIPDGQWAPAAAAERRRVNRAYIATRAKVYEGRPRTMADLVAKARLVIEDTRHSPDTDEWGVALAHDILALAGRRR